MGFRIIVTLAWSYSVVTMLKDLPQWWNHVIWRNFSNTFHFTCFSSPFDSHIPFNVISCAARSHQVTFGGQGEYWWRNGVGHGQNFDLGKLGQDQMKRHVLTFAMEKTLGLESEKQGLPPPLTPAKGAPCKHSKPQFPPWGHNPLLAVLTSSHWGEIPVGSSLR